MKAKDTSLLTIMRNATQSIILVYQRTHSWKLEQCVQLPKLMSGEVWVEQKDLMR